jgi:hypothetical protein
MAACKQSNTAQQSAGEQQASTLLWFSRRQAKALALHMSAGKQSNTAQYSSQQGNSRLARTG